MRMHLRTPICDLFGIDYPIVLAGMGGASGPELAAAVSNAGGLGVLGAAACPPDELDEWVRRTRGLTDRPFGVDTLLPASVPDNLDSAALRTSDGRAGSGSLIPPGVLEARDRFMDAEGLPRRKKGPSAPETPKPPRMLLVRDFFDAQLEVVLDHKVPVYVAGLGVPPPEFMVRGRQHGMRFMGVAGQSRHVAKLAQAGVDAIVAQGTDGGGHNSPIGTLALIPQAVDAARSVPVLGAGGISDGRGVAAAFMLGAVGVWVGTRFLATPEANIPHYQKQVLLSSTDRDTMVSRSATGKPARVIRAKWAELYERGEIDALPMPLQGIVATPVMAAAIANQRADVFAGFAGQGVGLVHDLTPAGQVFERLVAEATALLDGVTTLPDVTASRAVRA
jgi:NAD(P)H-dependent flavin oxidoreductase YrpB (nitropropane dioxygenase family)